MIDSARQARALIARPFIRGQHALYIVACGATLLSATRAVAQAGQSATATASAAAASTTAQTLSPPEPGVDLAFDERAKLVSSRLRCPVCQGESIQDSPAELSTQMKTLVREQLYAGRSEREVLDYFVEKYGQWILLEPRAEGINLLVYGLPILFLVLGGGVLVVLVRRWTRANGPTADLSPAVATRDGLLAPQTASDAP